MPAGPSSLGQQRREPLHPAVDGDMVDLDAPLSQQLFDVAVGQAKAQVSADRDDDDIGWEAKPAKADRGAGAGRVRRVLMRQSHCSKAVTANATPPVRVHLETLIGTAVDGSSSHGGSTRVAARDLIES
jgi:hypothetical protein